MAAKLRYITRDRDRHGTVRRYFRTAPASRKVRMAEPFGSPAFWDHYGACLDAHAKRLPIPPAAAADHPAVAPPDRPLAGTWRWLCADYMGSAAFRALDASTQRTRRAILDSTCQEPIAPGDARTFAAMPLRHFGRRAVIVLRDRKAGTPDAANNRLKAVRAVFRWALASAIEPVTADPTRDVPRLHVASQGHHSWTVDEVDQYRSRHGIGTTARLALELLLLTGVRRSDVVKIGRQHRRGDWLRFTPTKGAKRAPQILDLPVLPQLAAVIAASPTGDLAYLATAYGRPFTAAGFGNRFRAWCDEAGLHHCSAHGLRKAGAAIAAENGATAHQLMAIYGWRTLAEAERYTRAASQKKLAGEAMGHLVARSDGGTPHGEIARNGTDASMSHPIIKPHKSNK